MSALFKNANTAATKSTTENNLPKTKCGIKILFKALSGHTHSGV
jgi:hypothetical protein